MRNSQKINNQVIKMREIEKLANEKFDGDIEKAIDYAYRNWGSTINDRMNKIYSEFTKEELQIACKVIRNLAIERSGKKAVESFEKSIGYMKLLNMSDEEIINAPDNPYIKPCALSVALLVIAIVFGVFTNNKTIAEILIAVSSVSLVPNLIKCFQFNRAKKLLTKDNITTGE